MTSTSSVPRKMLAKLRISRICLFVLLPMCGILLPNSASVLGQNLTTIDQIVAQSTTTISATNDGALCARICQAGRSRICHYTFVLEHYQAMGVACGRCAAGNSSDCNAPQCIVGDGFERGGVMSINRQLPGPALHVCQNDLLVIDVVNRAGGTTTTLHWHGMSMRQTPYMDGVPYVTQCPIAFSNTFRYSFVATDSGTHFYHAHAGHHKENGQYGALVVRQPTSPQVSSYDYDLMEHLLVISSWMHVPAESLMPGTPNTILAPDAVLINGRGSYIEPSSRVRQARIPPQVYFLQAGKRYRFRVIHAGSHACPFKVQAQRHLLRIIASDGFNVEPRTFDALIINSGERYDFVLLANNTRGDYWLRVSGLGACSRLPTESLALLRYRRADASLAQDAARPLPTQPNFNINYPENNVLNNPMTGCRPGDQCVNELISLERDEQLQCGVVQNTIYLSFNNYVVSNAEIFRSGYYKHFLNLNANTTVVGAINNLSLTFPPYPPLTQPELIDDAHYCDARRRPATCANQRQCMCVHRLQVPLGGTVQLVIVDESESVGPIHHPFHLHGHRFTVHALGQHPQGTPMTVALAQSMAHRGQLLPAAAAASSSSCKAKPPFKDTVSIPSRGYAVVRFRADNPGFWLLHCHYEWHLAVGMGLILQVGQLGQMVRPPANFPRCYNYMPPIEWPHK
ncbi:laccase-2-like [Scaptodrosophila lebanonensis]|uniref:Laccase-2-like n=1 Tax=Drosophila lebanonensis TaxID=7225 RepID=A0A6J2TMH2_DROLE|nr:laccase-2-like [Scaptodrosophila lebanonensis]